MRKLMGKLMKRLPGKILTGVLMLLFLMFAAAPVLGNSASAAAVYSIGEGGQTIAKIAGNALAAETVLVKEAEPAGDADLAEETSPCLIYEDAVALALKNSLELKNARQSVEQAEEMRDHVSGMRPFGYTPLGPGYDAYDALDRELLLNFVQADIAWQMARKQVGILEEGIAFQVKNAYDEVLKKEAELTLADQALDYAAKKLRQSEIKVECGMESFFSFRMAGDDYNEEKQKIKTLEKQLEKAYLDFNALLSLEQDERLELQGEFSPDWLADVNLERHLLHVFQENPLLWLQEQKIKTAEQGLDLYTYNVGAPPYKVREIDVIKEKTNLAAMKDDLETTVLSLYNQLQQLESQYALLEVNLTKAQSALNLQTVRCNLGMGVAIDLQQAELTVAQLNHQLQNILMAYDQLKLLFEKPWLKPTSF